MKYSAETSIKSLMKFAIPDASNRTVSLDTSNVPKLRLV